MENGRREQQVGVSERAISGYSLSSRCVVSSSVRSSGNGNAATCAMSVLHSLTEPVGCSLYVVGCAGIKERSYCGGSGAAVTRSPG